PCTPSAPYAVTAFGRLVWQRPQYPVSFASRAGVHPGGFGGRVAGEQSSHSFHGATSRVAGNVRGSRRDATAPREISALGQLWTILVRTGRGRRIHGNYATR